MDQPIMHCLVSVRADEAAAWSLKRTLLRDSPGDLQWGVKGAPFLDTAQTMITGALFP